MFPFLLILFFSLSFAQEPPSPEDPSDDSENDSVSKDPPSETIPTEQPDESYESENDATNSTSTTEEKEVQEDSEEPEEPTIEELLQLIDKERFDLPIPYTTQVQYWVEYFSNSGRWTLSKWIRASGRYRTMILKELRAAGLPSDLLYVVMIESGFDPTATSSAEAVGIWQFIPSTGERYGLTINEYIDERRDPQKATKAAIAYLSKLYREFGNWHLAIAAYNAGEGRVYKAIDKYGTINYWELCNYDDAFAQETMDYVPRILAVAILDKYPNLFGVPSTSRKAEPLIVKMAYAERNQHVQTLADAAEMELDLFLEYNPHLIAERIRIKEPEFIIYLPPEKADIYQQNIRRQGINRISSGRSMTDEEIARYRSVDPQDTSHHRKSFSHTVQEGETLEEIAGLYGLDVNLLKEWNKTEKAVPGDLLTLQKPIPKKLQRYTVTSGDSLKKIAKKHKCSVDDIRKWNGLSEEATVTKGDVLWLKVAQ